MLRIIITDKFTHLEAKNEPVVLYNYKCSERKRIRVL